MPSESLRNLRPSWIGFGWFIAAAVTALILLGLAAFGVLPPDSTGAGGTWVALALLLGFLAGGFMTGWRIRAAPVLHGVGIGLFSLLVWLLANLVPGEATGGTAWRELPPLQAGALILLQAAAAVVGARAGVRWGRVEPAVAVAENGDG